MALLQISEPGQSTAPHQHKLAAGIDLGTTNSLIATVRSAQTQALPDASGALLLPSVVRYLPELGVLVGQEAQKHQTSDPQNTIVSVKRFMGRSLSDVQTASSMPYRFCDDQGMLSIATIAGKRSPVQISAEILTALRQRAEATLGGALAGVVITVPAYFDDAQRQATKDAARLAGLTVLRLLNEPTAAAIAYGLDKAAEGTFAIYDLGGGTFDISILRLTRGVFEVLATGGDSGLGGDDFDHAIAQWFCLQHGIAGMQSLPPGAQRSLLTSARSAKEELSRSESVAITLADAGHCACQAILSRAQFDHLTAALVERTLRATKRALRDADRTVDDITGVVLVGGSTRMPSVRAAVRQCFGRDPLADIDPDQVVALGAALQADVLAGNANENDWLLLDVCPLSLGIETMGGLVEKIIERNSTLPTARAQEFTTFKDGQTAMSLHVLQGERESAAHCRSLARFELRGIPPAVAGSVHIRVTFQIDADGLLSVSAREKGSGVEAHIEVKPSFGLSDTQISVMLEDAVSSGQQDMQLRSLREAQVDARRLLDATEAALAADTALLAPAEIAEIRKALFEVADKLETSASASILRTATTALGAATSSFAARRMNSSIQKALSGRAMSSLA